MKIVTPRISPWARDRVEIRPLAAALAAIVPAIEVDDESQGYGIGRRMAA